MTPYEERQVGEKQPTTIKTNQFIENILKRKTARAFDPTKKISVIQLKYLMTVALCSPTSSMAQCWSVIALISDEEKQGFLDTCGPAIDGSVDKHNTKAIKNCSVFLIFMLDNYKQSVSIDLGAKEDLPWVSAESVKKRALRTDFKNTIDIFFPQTDVSISNNWRFDSNVKKELLNQSYYSIRSILDATIAAQTFCLAAESLGMQTLYMGSVSSCKINCFKDYLKMPEKTWPLFGVCVGYEPEEGTDFNGFKRKSGWARWFRNHCKNKLKPRAPLDMILFFKSYKIENIVPNILKYNNILINFFQQFGFRSDYIMSKIVLRVKKQHDYLKRMRWMGNLLDK